VSPKKHYKKKIQRKKTGSGLTFDISLMRIFGVREKNRVRPYIDISLMRIFGVRVNLPQFNGHFKSEATEKKRGQALHLTFP